MERTTDIYVNKVFHLAKSCGVTHKAKEGINKKALKLGQKNQFFGPILTILNISIKTLTCLMHHLACHQWSKFQAKLLQTKLTTFWGVLAKTPPKKGVGGGVGV